MAALEAGQFQIQYQDGQTDRMGVYLVKGVNDGDTFDASNSFREVRRAAFCGSSVDVTGVCAVGGTTVTLPAGLAGDAGFVIVYGISV